MKKLRLRIGEDRALLLRTNSKKRREAPRREHSHGPPLSLPAMSLCSSFGNTLPMPNLHQPRTHVLGAIPSQQCKDPTPRQPRLLSSAWLVFPLYSCVSTPQSHEIMSSFLISLQFLSWLHFIQNSLEEMGTLVTCPLLPRVSLNPDGNTRLPSPLLHLKFLARSSVVIHGQTQGLTPVLKPLPSQQ